MGDRANYTVPAMQDGNETFSPPLPPIEEQQGQGKQHDEIHAVADCISCDDVLLALSILLQSPHLVSNQELYEKTICLLEKLHAAVRTENCSEGEFSVYSLNEELDVLQQSYEDNDGYADYESLRSKIFDWLKICRPVDFPLMKTYLCASFERADAIVGKDVVFLVGSSGVGKTTLLHFLCGSKFEKLGSKKMTKTDSQFCAIEDCTTSSAFQSTTRYIRPVVLKPDVLAQLGAPSESPLVLVDCPGFEDTDGPEIDIANCFGMLRAARCCRSAKLLFVCDNQIGIKGGSLLQNIDNLVRIMGNNVSAYARSILILFTKYENTEDIKDDIKNAMIRMGRNRSNLEGTQDFLKVFPQKTENPYLVPLLSNDPSELLNMILQMEPITNPSEAFKPFVSSNSNADLTKQFRRCEEIIESYLPSSNISVAIEKLKLLHEVNELLGTDFTGGRVAEKRIAEVVENLTIIGFERLFERIQRNHIAIECKDINELKAKLMILLELREVFPSGQVLWESCILRLQSYLFKQIAELDSILEDFSIVGSDMASGSYRHIPSVVLTGNSTMYSIIDRIGTVLGNVKDICVIHESVDIDGEALRTATDKISNRITPILDSLDLIKAEVGGSNVDYILNIMKFLRSLSPVVLKYCSDQVYSRLISLADATEFTSWKTNMFTRALCCNTVTAIDIEMIQNTIDWYQTLRSIKLSPNAIDLLDFCSLDQMTRSYEEAMLAFANQCYSDFKALIPAQNAMIDYGALSLAVSRLSLLQSQFSIGHDCNKLIREFLDGQAFSLKRAFASVSIAYDVNLAISIKNLTLIPELLGDFGQYYSGICGQVINAFRDLWAAKFDCELSESLLVHSQAVEYCAAFYCADACSKLLYDLDCYAQMSAEESCPSKSIYEGIKFTRDLLVERFARFADLLIGTNTDSNEKYFGYMRIEAYVVDQLQEYSDCKDIRSIRNHLTEHGRKYLECLDSFVSKGNTLLDGLGDDAFKQKSLPYFTDLIDNIGSALAYVHHIPCEIENSAIGDQAYCSFVLTAKNGRMLILDLVNSIFHRMKEFLQQAIEQKAIETLRFVKCLASEFACKVDPSITCLSTECFASIESDAASFLSQIVNDSVAKFESAIASKNYCCAVDMILSGENGLTSDDKCGLVEKLQAEGKRQHASISRLINIDAEEKLNLKTFHLVQTELKVLRSYQVAVSQLSPRFELGSMLQEVEGSIQQVLFAKITSIFGTAYLKNDYLEFEDLTSYLRDVLTDLVEMPNHKPINFHKVFVEYLCPRLLKTKCTNKCCSKAHLESSVCDETSFRAAVGFAFNIVENAIVKSLSDHVDSLINAEVISYNTNHPKEFVSTLRKCIGKLESFRHISESQRQRLYVYQEQVAKFIDGISQKLIQFSSSNCSLQELQDRLSLLNQVLYVLPDEVGENIKPNITRLSDFILSEKSAREVQKSKIGDCKLEDCKRLVDVYCKYIYSKDFAEAAEFKIVLCNRLEGVVKECHIQLKRKDLRGISSAIVLDEVLFQLVSAVDSCRHANSEVVVAKHAVNKNRNGFYVTTARGMRYLKMVELTTNVKKTKIFEERSRSFADIYPDSFSDNGIRGLQNGLKYCLQQTMSDLVLCLHQASAECINCVEQSILSPVRKLAIITIFPFIAEVLKSSEKSARFHSLYVAQFVQEIQPSMMLASNAIAALVKELNDSFDRVQVDTLSTYLGHSADLEGSVEEWLQFTQSTIFKTAFPDAKFDFGCLLFSRMRDKLDSSIPVWIARLLADSYVDNPRTSARNQAAKHSFYKEVKLTYEAVTSFDKLAKYSKMNFSSDFIAIKKGFLEHMTQQITLFSNKLIDLCPEMPFSNEALYSDCDIYIDNLQVIAEVFSDGEVGKVAQIASKRVVDKFDRRFGELRERSLVILEAEKPDYNDCLDQLVGLKAISNKFGAYSKQVDKLIDEITLTLRQHHNGAKYFGHIALQLQRRALSDDGDEHVQSLLQHAAFKDIQNILRRQVTKKFTIYHVLGFKEPASPDAKLEDNTDSTAVCIEEFDLSTTLVSQTMPKVSRQIREGLYCHYREFDKLYWDLVKAGIFGDKQKQLKSLQSVMKTVKRKNMPSDFVWFRTLLAHIFAYWTLRRYSNFLIASDSSTSSSSSFSSSRAAASEDQFDALFQPHPAQVVAIFRLFGIEEEPFVESFGTKAANVFKALNPFSSDNITFNSHLVEVLTGEGKSVVMAVSATLLALLGFEVHCACYSNYLSERDAAEFKDVFDAFGVRNSIYYGNFGSLCEKMINSRGDIRSAVVDLITHDTTSAAHTDEAVLGCSRKQLPKILFIDEVDVFFSSEFYGRQYHPIASLNSPKITQLFMWMWKNRANLKLETVTSSEAYTACLEEFQSIADIMKKIIVDMFFSLEQVKKSSFKPYHIVNVRGVNYIGYKEQDGLVTNEFHGYQTSFHYIKEFEANQITELTLNETLNAHVDCGVYSYAEIPKSYTRIVGVTGTLRQNVLGTTPMKEQFSRYGIHKFSFIPSVYGRTKRQFRENSLNDVRIVENADFHNTILKEIEGRMRSTNENSRSERCVLVFFKDRLALEAFCNSNEFASSVYASQAHVLTEITSETKRDTYIRMAASSHQLTLLSSEFGRGTDFICYDQNLLQHGGVHVMQTFLSEQFTEEVQIMGRTARQGQEGSFGMVLKIEDLERLGITKTAAQNIISSGILHSSLDTARNEFYRQNTYRSLENEISRATALHNESKLFSDLVFDGNIAEVKKRVLKWHQHGH